MTNGTKKTTTEKTTAAKKTYTAAESKEGEPMKYDKEGDGGKKKYSKGTKEVQ